LFLLSFHLIALTWSNIPFSSYVSGATLIDRVAMHGTILSKHANDDGSIMLFRNFMEYEKVNRYGIVSLHSNGTLDTTLV
jgi:hypothetical protein